MAEKVLNTRISLHRDSEANWQKIQNSFTPLLGEICFIDTSRGLRAKVGDGVNYLANLPYSDEQLISDIESIVIPAYFLNDKMWKDSTYTEEVTKAVNKIYIDKNSNIIYHWDGSNWISVNDTLPTASDLVAGISKLYNIHGQNIDGSMTQKAITDGIDEIEFAVDENDTECLVLSKPW